jgi:hypothetical protein
MYALFQGIQKTLAHFLSVMESRIRSAQQISNTIPELGHEHQV